MVSSVRLRAVASSADWAKREGGSRGIGRCERGGCVEGAEEHLFCAAAGGDESDAGFDEAHVGFSVRLAARGVQADFRAAAEGEAEGRGDDRARAEFDGRGHLLEVVNDAGQLVPLAFLRGEKELHEVGADGEVFAVAGDDEAGEIANRIGRGVEHGGDERKNVAADGVLERMQFDAGDAVAEIDERSAGIGADDARVRRKSATRAWPGTAGMGMAWPVAGWKQASAIGRVPGGARSCEKRLDWIADGKMREPSCGRQFRPRLPHPTFRKGRAPN